MAVLEETRRALELGNLSIAPSLPILRVEAEDYCDSAGDAALRILVVIDEAVEIEKVGGKAIGDLKSSIRDSIRNHGITLFAYIRLAKPSELAETDETDETDET